MTKAHWITLLLLSLVVLSVAPSVGADWISPWSALHGDNSDTARALYLQLRLPRVLLGFVVGASLAASGVAFQGMFRNALASPFTLGVSGGAAVGAAISIFFHIPGSSVFALSGALVTALLVWIFSIRRRSPALAILLSGVVLSFFFSSVIMLLQYLGDFGEVFRLTHWMLGTLEVVGFEGLVLIAPLVLIGIFFLFWDVKALNLLSLGEEFAQSKGVNVRRTQLRILLGVSFIIGGVVSVCGPIGFVGIIVPFLCRALVGYEHTKLLPVSLFAGGMFLVICDTLSRTMFSPLELPVGVCTALIGGPAFLWMLLRGGLQ